MYLTKLEIFGFKSFPEKTKVEFAQGVSAIVGPNGSGKSNIVDALRWVLGEQGDKALRSERRDDVVFSGTRTRKPLSIAEVSLTIDNSKMVLPTEYREVQIARRFFRSGDTEYFLNGTKVRLKDVKNIFINTGIGPDAYSVIELKMIETILSSVKNERRKMFEEAAGIISYKYNRDLTLKRLESVRESLLRVNDIIREKQRNLNMLERQVKKNEEAKLVFENLRKLELLSGNIEFNIYTSEVQEIKDHESENLSLKEKTKEEITVFDLKIDELNDNINEIDIKITDLVQKIELKKEEINQTERHNLVAEQKIKNSEGTVKRLTDDNFNLKSSLEINSDKFAELKRKTEILKNTLIVSEQSLEDKKYKLDRTIETITGKKNEIIHLGSRLKDINKTLGDSKSDYQTSKVKFDNNLERLNQISSTTQSYLIEIENYENNKTDLDKILITKNELLKSAEKELNDNSLIKSNLQKTIKSLEQDISNLRIELQKKDSKINYLENMLETFEDYAEGVKFLVKDNNEKDLKTVIDSVNVDDKYRISVETALGEVSNYLILKDSRNLDKYLTLLNKSDKGKVTFILNDKLFSGLYTYTEYPEFELDFLNERGVIGFANKFVKCNDSDDQRLLNFLLDEYVIVEDINIAFKLSNDNYYKFVTLEGDIVTEGVVRAGSKLNEDTIKIGRQERIALLRKEIEEFRENVKNKENSLRNKLSDFESINLGSFHNKVDGIKKEISELQNEISKIDYSISTINKSINEDDIEYKKIQKENTNLNKRINELIEVVNKNENDNSNIDKELTFLTNEFDEIEKQYSEIQKDYNNFHIEVNSLKNELKNEENSLSRVSNTLEYQTKQKGSNTKSIADENALLDNFAVSIQNNNNKLAELKTGMEELQTEFNKIKVVSDSYKDELNKINLEQRQRRSIFDKVSQILIDAQIKIKENTIRSEQTFNHLHKKYEFDITDPNAYISSEPLTDEFRDDNGEINLAALKRNIEELDVKLKKLGGGYQQLVWDSFQTEKDDLDKIINQRNDLTESEKEIKKTIDKINQEAQEMFLKTFEKIKDNFIQIFKELFQEGDEANLRLIYEEDENGKVNDDPLEAKIEIVAKPRGKKPTSIELLSGGEKTLTASALLFAIYLVKPSPFCVLDEVDAPLDPANLVRFNKMIRKFSSNTQFILITHNERTMETVDRLYGVTMQEPGVTTIVETKFKNASEKIQA